MKDQSNAEPPQIIVRAYDDEPHVLYAVRVQPSGRHVNVCRDLPARPIIGWPIEDAFDYDIDDFAALHHAYNEGRKDDLKRLYQELRERPRNYLVNLPN